MSNIEIVTQPQIIELVQETQTLVVNPSTGAVTVVSSGPVGPRGTGSGYSHTQASASDIWTINHNLGYRPSAQTFNVGGIEVLGEVQHISSNQLTVTFNTAIAGTARLS